MTLPRRAWLAAPLLLIPGCSTAQNESLVRSAKRFSATVNGYIQRFPLVPASIKAEFAAANATIQAIASDDVTALLREELRILVMIGQRAAIFIPEPAGTAVRVILGFLAGIVGDPPLGVTGMRMMAPGLPPLPAAGLADAEAAAKVLQGAK